MCYTSSHDYLHKPPRGAKFMISSVLVRYSIVLIQTLSIMYSNFYQNDHRQWATSYVLVVYTLPKRNVSMGENLNNILGHNQRNILREPQCQFECFVSTMYVDCYVLARLFQASVLPLSSTWGLWFTFHSPIPVLSTEVNANSYHEPK